jgi:DUF4097 and DUF4098 domain-containing protein YvlB
MTTKLSPWVLSACLLGLSGCELEDFGSSRYSKDFHYSYPLKPGGKLSVETFNGAVEVTAWDQDMVEIDGAKYGPSPEAADALKVDIANGPDSIAISVSRSEDFRGNRGARFSVKMSRKSILDHVTSSNGSIVLQGVLGPARLRTSNGSIRVSDSEGGLDAHTSNGGIELTDVTGDTVARTSNAHIRAENLKGPLEASTSNSSITASFAQVPFSRSVRLETSNAGVDLALPSTFGAPSGPGVRVGTSNGQITVRLPSSVNAQVLARTNNSSITSDFEMKLQGEARKNHLDAVIGSGGPLLDLSTSNAAIRLLKL